VSIASHSEIIKPINWLCSGERLGRNVSKIYSLSPNNVWIEIERSGIDFRNGQVMYLFFKASGLDVQPTESILSMKTETACRG